MNMLEVSSRPKVFLRIERNEKTRLSDVKLHIPHYRSKQISRCMKPLDFFLKSSIAIRIKRCLSPLLTIVTLLDTKNESLRCLSSDICGFKHGNPNSSKKSLPTHGRYVAPQCMLSKLTPRAGDILNYALTLEHLEDKFYREGLANYSHNAFVEAGFLDPFYENLKEVSSDETAHVDFLTKALKAAGVPSVLECTYSFPSTDPKSFVALSSVLEGDQHSLESSNCLLNLNISRSWSCGVSRSRS